MKFENLSQIARYIVEDGKGILAADESNPTCKKRFDTISVESTEGNRRDYRELLFSSEGMEGYIGGVILFDDFGGFEDTRNVIDNFFDDKNGHFINYPTGQGVFIKI